MMTEKLLQFIWKNRYFNHHKLELVTGEVLLIDYPGELNTCQGPDFLNARIRINGQSWTGSIELHLYSSGWTKHHHTEDGNYQNVMLHVVWKQDRLEMTRNIPQLELCNRIPGFMLETYTGWMARSLFIPCEGSVSKISQQKWENWGSRILIRRLNRKMHQILDSLRTNHYHWEQQLWWMMARNFGNPVNTTAFELIARSIPYSLLAKHRNQFIQLEALFLGQANLLENKFCESYPNMLKKEYEFLRKKYHLKKIYEPVHFLRMRPDNFPGIRLSQLAAFFTRTTNFFTWILECENITQLRSKFTVTANDYWHNHYIFDKPSVFREKILGRGMCDNIIINSVIPLLYTYGKIIPDTINLKKAICWLEELPAEQNQIIQNWKLAGISVKKAAGTQALKELKIEFCDQRKCLECDIGKYLLQPDMPNS